MTERKGSNSPSNTPTSPTPSEIGRKGGLVVKERYGSDYYSKIGKKGGEAVKEKHGSDYFATIGKLGGTSPKRRKENNRG